jgi:hypothetical protein
LSCVHESERLIIDAFSHGQQGHLHTYRFCDDLWTFILENATIRMVEGGPNETLNADRIKIIACNAKRPGTEERKTFYSSNQFFR